MISDFGKQLAITVVQEFFNVLMLSHCGIGQSYFRNTMAQGLDGEFNHGLHHAIQLVNL